MNFKTFAFAASLTSILVACAAHDSTSDLESATDVTASEINARTCNPKKCGPPLGMPAIMCDDGSVGGNTGNCIKDASGCHWEVRACPTPKPPPPVLDCTVKGACGPELGMPSQQCDDGTVAGPTCVDVGGKCGWKITECPKPPPGEVCGKNVCGAKQTCCSGMPFPEPTCIDGTMCPISQRKHKKDIQYLSESDRQRLNDELLGFRLATYRYKSEGEAERAHLGFIIDDVAPSPAVTSAAERVDMYGYATMTVASLQVQAREIAELRREIAQLRANAKR